MRELTQISDSVHVAVSRLMHTTSTVITDGTSALLIDPAWLPDELDALGAWLANRELNVIGGFATHAHHDHRLWHPSFGTPHRWGSVETARLAADERAGLVEALGDDFPGDLTDLMGRVEAVPVPEEIPSCSVPTGVEIELLTHNGHAPGHTAVWLPREHVLIAGDMLSDVELPLPFWPDDVCAYVAALDRLAEVARLARIVIPGHGTIGSDPLSRLDDDRRYLDDVLSGRKSDDRRIGAPGMAEMHERLQQIVADGI